MKEESTLAGIHFSSASKPISNCDSSRLRSKHHSRSLSAPITTYSNTPSSLSTIPNLPPQSTYPTTFTNEAHVHKRNLQRRYTQIRASSLNQPKNLAFCAQIDLAHNSVQPNPQPQQSPSSPKPTLSIDTFPGVNQNQKKQPPCKDAPSSQPHPQPSTSPTATTISRTHSDTRSAFLAAKNNYINSCNSEATAAVAATAGTSPSLASSSSPRSIARSTFSAPPGDIVPRRHFVYPDSAGVGITPEQALALANLELMSGRTASPAPSVASSVSVVQTTTATGAPKPTTGAIASLVLPSALVPYIWPTSPASFCTGVVVGLGLALLRPIIEHYVDISAGYVAVGMRYVLIWGSVGLIAWVVLRVLQQTSKATLILNPADGASVPTEQPAGAAGLGSSVPSSPVRGDQDSYFDHVRYARHNSTATTSAGGLESSASSIYSSAGSLTSASSTSTSASSLYYSPPTPQYNPYSRSTSPVRSVQQQQPSRKPVAGTVGVSSLNTASSSASLRSGSPTRRMMAEPRIVALDEHLDNSSGASFRPYSGTGGYRKAGDGILLEKGIGQNAFRIQRG